MPLSFGQKIKEARKTKKLTQKELANIIGAKHNSVSDWENDKNKPDPDTIEILCGALEITPNYLLATSSDDFSPTEKKIIEKYRSLDPIGQETVNFILDRECNHVKQLNELNISTDTNVSNIRHIQYYQRLASAGTGQIVFEDIPIDIIEIPDIREYRDVKYAIGVSGHSMEPLYEDGDTLLVAPTKEISNNEIGIFILDGESFVKRLGQNELISANNEYDNIPFTPDIRCVGRVIDKLETKEPSYDFEKDYNTKLEEMTGKILSHFDQNNTIPEELHTSFYKGLEKKKKNEA